MMEKIIWTSQVQYGDPGLLYPVRVLVVGVDIPLAAAMKWVDQGVADVYVEPVVDAPARAETAREVYRKRKSIKEANNG
jgi:hypothetical protein